jgi:regulator of protease activity HflC (stomatin/prohibitin superfamily)
VVIFALLGLIAMQSPQVAQQWERAVVLRLGRFSGLRGPGLFWIVPFADSVSSWVDQRTITTSFAAEQTLTSDTVPVSVDAVLFWMVHDVQKAALEVQDYSQAVSWAAQTALRDIIGRTPLTESASRYFRPVMLMRPCRSCSRSPELIRSEWPPAVQAAVLPRQAILRRGPLKSSLSF